jgi:protease I
VIWPRSSRTRSTARSSCPKSASRNWRPANPWWRSGTCAPIQAFQHLDKGKTISVNRTLADAKPEEYDALLLPGGALNADQMRVLPEVQLFARHFNEVGKPMAVICHAPWILVSADLVEGRTLTSYHTIQDDVRNAGGHWVDQEVVEDGNWVTSRQPSDIPAFIDAFFATLKRAPAIQHG